VGWGIKYWYQSFQVQTLGMDWKNVYCYICIVMVMIIMDVVIIVVLCRHA